MRVSNKYIVNEDLILRLDQLLREGRSLEVKQELTLIKKKKLDRDISLKVANIARRARDVDYAFRLLQPFVRIENGEFVDSKNEELLEYACLLTYIGAISESLSIFSKIKNNKLPDSYLFFAFTLFRQWKYQEAIALLTEYISLPGISDYQIATAKVNLAAAYCFVGNYHEVNRLISELVPQLTNSSNTLLLGNCFEILGQSSIFQNNLSDAKNQLLQAKTYLKNAQSLYLLFTEKWLAIASAFENGKPEALQEIRKKSIAIKHWETLRDCDLFEAIATRNEKLFLYVYVGTPHAAYRDRMLKLWNQDFFIPKKYDWLRFYDQAVQNSIFDLTTFSNKDSIKVDLPIKMLNVLATDFYNSFHVGTLFAQLHPEERYNHQTSPHRIYDTIRRLRDYLLAQKIPLTIKNHESTYRLFFDGPCALRIWTDIGSHLYSEEYSFLSLLENTFKNSNFSAQEVSEKCRLPIRTVQRKLKQLYEKKLINKINTTKRSVSYGFCHKL